ncbi:MAG: hypothetical protein O9297_04555 [Flavobacterium sp.]|jgi:hypothetical protein|nr:hypothetical protein [Flavobacterium sp.]MCZ8169633.1 hypothetical protein [Flavobacterium sp.]MCZ8296474.1 hypothetical protein [Flavobacterium sp.]
MRNFFAILVLWSISLHGQKFAPGYYVDNFGDKHEGFIEDSNNFNSPEKIYFKTSLTDKTQEIGIANVKEFKVNTNYKFERHSVEYDADQTQIKDETKIFGEKPNLKSRLALLKVLVEGNTILYKGVFEEIVFYYAKKKTESTPQLLLSRKYVLNNQVRTANPFQIQLFRFLSTNVNEVSSFNTLEYNDSDLSKIVTKYNAADNSLVQDNVDKEKYKGVFSIRFLAGLSQVNASLERPNFNPKQDGTSIGNPLFGAEVAYRSGYDAKRYEFYGKVYFNAMQLDGSYQRPFSNSSNGFDGTIRGEINVVTMGFGARYALLNKNKHRLNLGAGINFSKTISGDFTIIERVSVATSFDPLTFQTTETTYTKSAKSNAIFFSTGLQYMFNNRYGIEVEYQLPRNYLERVSPNIIADISTISLTLIYGLKL